MVITKYHTDSDPASNQRPPAADSEASLRAELAERISGAQAEIEHHLTELRRAASAGGDATPLLQADAQREGLGRLQHRLAQAHGAGLVSIRAEVSAFVAAAQAVAQQTRTVAATAQAAETALHAASAAAHREVTDFVRDFYERKIFDPYLRFASAEDEEAYRKREEDYQRDIKAALALGTPEGELRALELVEAQMLDAKAHGAGDSGQFAPMAASIASKKAALKAALGGEAELGAPSPPVDEATRTAPTPDKSTDPLAALREAGVVLADPNEDGHGVPRSAVSPPAKGRA